MAVPEGLRGRPDAEALPEDPLVVTRDPSRRGRPLPRRAPDHGREDGVPPVGRPVVARGGPVGRGSEGRVDGKASRVVEVGRPAPLAVDVVETEGDLILEDPRPAGGVVAEEPGVEEGPGPPDVEKSLEGRQVLGRRVDDGVVEETPTS